MDVPWSSNIFLRLMFDVVRLLYVGGGSYFKIR
jgi:hypothetical protein